MNFGVELDNELDETQLEAIHILEQRLDRAWPRITNHVTADGFTLVVSTFDHNVAFTGMWRFRGAASAITVTGEDWFHTWSVFQQQVCRIFKVGYWNHHI